MRKVVLFIIVAAFWGIFYFGLSKPKIDGYILGISIICIFLCIILLGKRFIWKLMDNPELPHKKE
jgi:hypothetical protein